ncbi:hypothetical protein DPMN_044450, partial [Dreissena polymorpha]
MTLAERCLRWLRSSAVITGVPVNDSVQSPQFRVFAEHRGRKKPGTGNTRGRGRPKKRQFQQKKEGRPDDVIKKDKYMVAQSTTQE